MKTHHLQKIERERDAKLVQDLVVVNRKQMTTKSRDDVENAQEWFLNKHHRDWTSCIPKKEMQ